jgi:SAM-dependent methyltransferase
MSFTSPSFYNAVAGDYGERWTIEEEVRRGAASFLKTTDRPVEIACGNGRLLRNLPAGTIGLDFSPAMLALAARRNSGAPFVLGDARRLPLRLAGRTAVAVNILHNLDDPAAVLDEIARAGATRLVTDFRNRLNPVVFAKDLRHRRGAIAYRALTFGAMKRLLAAAGFAVRRRRAIHRPLTDPGKGFRPRHLLGALLSRIPGLAPSYTVDAVRIPRGSLHD